MSMRIKVDIAKFKEQLRATAGFAPLQMN